MKNIFVAAKFFYYAPTWDFISYGIIWKEMIV